MERIYFIVAAATAICRAIIVLIKQRDSRLTFVKESNLSERTRKHRFSYLLSRTSSEKVTPGRRMERKIPARTM